MNITKEMLAVSTYESPEVEVIEVQVEKGFALSDPTGEIDPWE